MAKSNAQRQSDYRVRHLKDVDGQAERLNLLVNLHAKRALERLAACYAVTQREVLEEPASGGGPRRFEARGAGSEWRD
jgi:hypothetical protein